MSGRECSRKESLGQPTRQIAVRSGDAILDVMTNLIGRAVLHFNSVTSTNDVIRARAEAGEPEGLVVSAEQQTAGRGRMGRSWVAPPGTSIQMSVLLRPPLPPTKAYSLIQMAAIGVSSALRKCVESIGYVSPPQVKLKWPNDVLLNSKKCAGILVESAVEGSAFNFVVLGIGINVNFSMHEFPELEPAATTLADEVGHDVDRGNLQETLILDLDKYYERLCSGEEGELAVFDEWRAQLATIGQRVRVATISSIEEGVVSDVTPDGALLLKRDGKLLRLEAGEVTLLKEQDPRRFG